MGKRMRVGVFRGKTSRGLPIGAYVSVADNTGARVAQIIAVMGYKAPKRRLASATVGDMVSVTIKKGTPEYRSKVFRAVVIRQRKPYRRISGERIRFEDNAVVLVREDGDPIGSEIRGPVAREAAEKRPKLAQKASRVV